MFALTVGVVGVLAWGAGYIVEQNTQAQKELAAARDQIAAERRAHQDALAARNREADAQIAARETEAQEAIEQARAAQAAAEVSVALAEAEALAAVQDTLLVTSERIQALVAGQLSSMEELEQVRTTTAAELNRQLAQLSERRTQLEEKLTRRQAEIDEKNQEIELSRVAVAFEVLLETVDADRNYRIADDAENLAGILDLSDAAQTEFLVSLLQERDDPTISAAVFLALYGETAQQDWLDRFIQALSPMSQLEMEWLNDSHWQTDVSLQAWNQIAKLALDEVDEGINEQSRTGSTLTFLSGLFPFEAQRAPDRMQNTNIWRYVVANIDTLRSDTQRQFGGRDFRALGRLFELAPAAAHVG